MKLKTARNFALVMDILQDVKYYSPEAAYRIARELFKTARADKKGRPVEYFLARYPENT